MFDLKVIDIKIKNPFKPVVKLLVLFWLLLDSLNLIAQEPQINIIPEPQRVTFLDGSFLINKNNGRLQVPGLTIYDWPDFQFRGISLDLSRGQVPNFENFKKIIRFISKYKMNTWLCICSRMFLVHQVNRV